MPGLVAPVFPLVFSRDREGHVKLNVSRREPVLLMDEMLLVGVILPVDASVEAVDDDKDEDDAKNVLSPSICLSLLLLLSSALSSSMLTGEEHDKLIKSFASRRTSLFLPSVLGSLL